MTAIAHAISAALLHFLWEGLAVALLLSVTLATLRTGSARVRYAVSCIALAILVALPIVTAWMVYQGPGAAVAGASQSLYAGDATSAGTLTPDAFLSRWFAAVEAWALPVWSAGVLIFSMRLIWGSRYVARLRREGGPAGPLLVETVSRLAQRMHIARPVRVLMSGLTNSPSVVGWLRPVILVPAASLINLSTSQLEAVLAHELAHVRRFDYLVNLMQTVAETLFFYQPGIWWVSSRMRRERELCCDDVVVEVGGDPIGYARALTLLERSRLASLDLAMTSTGGQLMYRIQRLTGVAHQRPASKVPAALAACLAMACVMTNLRWAQAQPQSGREAEVRYEAIWVDTVKYGDFPIMVRALGTVTTAEKTELQVVSEQAPLLQIGQEASIELRPGITAAGKVIQIDSQKVSGTVPVTVQMQSSVGEFAGRTVDGIIRVKTLNNVTYVGRPAGSPAGALNTIFKLDKDGKSASRMKVRFGASSVNNVQVLEGLQPGDRVILSDMSKYDGYDLIRLVE